MNSDGLDAHLAAGAMDTQRYLAPVRDEDFLEQCRLLED